MRINKYLSNLGYCSRKEANTWLEAGRIHVNGQLSFPGQWVEPTDDILLDGEPIRAKAHVYLLLNKPPGITCTADENVKDNIIEFLNYPGYIFPVGRLDKASQGLMLLTNDGELANQVLEAENGHEKAYRVTVDRVIDEHFLDSMARGVLVDGKLTKPCKLKALDAHTFEIILSQGLNRQIRKMCLVFHYKVQKLERTRIVNLELNDLALGAWREVTREELDNLKAIIKAGARTD